MFKQKGEVSLAAGLASTDDAEGVALQAAAALDSSFAVISSFYSLSAVQGNDFDGKGRYFEVGAGLFGKDRKKGMFVWDGYLGSGWGAISNESLNSTFDVAFFKPFVQGSIGLSTDYFEVALTSRIALLNYRKVEYAFFDPEYQIGAQNFKEDNNNKVLFEPGITIRGGYKNIKASLQICTSTFSLDSPYEDLSINSDFISFGLNYMFTSRYR